MLIEAGFTIAFECPAPTPMLLQLNVHPSRDADLLTPDTIASDPPLPMRNYLDLFGNRVTRVDVPAGLVTFSDRFVIADSGKPDETPPDVRTTPIADLPDEALAFLVSSRYCDSDKLADFAWSQFGKLSGGARVVQAISDFVHAKIRFSYADARSTRAASDSMQEGIGVCRDFAHLAIALCRCMNIPARYCTGYTSQRFIVCLGSSSAQPPSGDDARICSAVVVAGTTSTSQPRAARWRSVEALMPRSTATTRYLAWPAGWML